MTLTPPARPLTPPWFTISDHRLASSSKFVFTCEHASNHFGSLPIEAENANLIDTHWAYDLGAGDLSDALAKFSHSIAVLSTYSRLLLDANRAPGSTTLFLDAADGCPIECNRGLSNDEKAYRVQRLHDGFHAGISTVLDAQTKAGPCILVSVHSFTPVWCGEQRHVEVGVLFDRYATQAKAAVKILKNLGLAAFENEPYSGLTGELMYSATHHGSKHKIPYVEFEVRQDLIATHEQREILAPKLLAALAPYEALLLEPQ